jgi:hypothetical protein
MTGGNSIGPSRAKGPQMCAEGACTLAPKKGLYTSSKDGISNCRQQGILVVANQLARTDDARSLLRDLFRSEADLVPDLEQEVLRVRVHPMSNPRSNRAIAHLLEHLNAAEFRYPGTTLQLVYSIAGDAETPNLAPHQNPANQEV